MCDCGQRHSAPGFSSLLPSAEYTRRQWLRGATASIAAGLSLSHPILGWADNPAPSAPPLTPAQALQRLQAGNARYVAGKPTQRQPLAQRTNLTRGQWPYAAILSCADSRVPPELVFDAAEGELFVVRLAGNIASAEALASLEYAVHVLHVPCIVVMGHSQCGAIAATVHQLQSGANLPGQLPSLTQAITPALQKLHAQDPAQRLAQATALNVQHQVQQLRGAAPIVAPAVASGQLHIHGSVCDLASGRVNWL